MPAFGESPEGTIEILNIVPMQGPGGIVAPSCDAAISLAVAEINRGTGILGREIRTTNIDGGRPPHEVANEVSALLATGMVDAITGWHTSAVRRVVARAAASRVPYLFATGHEGLPDELPGVLMLGEHPAGQTLPALRWLAREHGVRRWAIIGNDYIWPRESVKAIRNSLADPGDIVLERYVPLGAPDFGDFLSHPALDKADGVVILMVGADVSRFNRQFAATGRAAEQLRISPAADENVLLAAGPGANHNFYVASSFFIDEQSPDGRSRVDRYRRLHGEFAPALTSFSNMTYEAVHTLAGLAHAVGSLRVPDVLGAIDHGVLLETPGGPRAFQGNQAIQHGYIARANGVEFDIVARIT
ncbi:ABC-type branched-subunit amino acid transport system substrate-binding protein [Nocardia tenerifensis]|uniref:ABC-type branched-subunit amino acid transport system substrate-binding protein n=1 Tax=Nocardia tenerifensis TaxID=228006 RepID=A0A318K9D8_9NOCA|nr:substrate-binding domain-containing protein [Nocardia tenerifensis]PXX66872.1 ABC-type branched-subunit amino acid transport system substrate-binding protein [Nocardia tenerifensis]